MPKPIEDPICSARSKILSAGTNQFCDPILGTCNTKLPTGASCALAGGDAACEGGTCSVAGDALPGRCHKASSEPYGGSCYANGQCTSGNCRTGAGFTCGCGGKASQCASDEYCGGAYADTCLKKLGVGQFCQNDNRQCSNGRCNYSSPGIYVCGCTGDEQCPYGEFCDVNAGNYTGAYVCRVRKPAGAACNRTGECWRQPANNNNPATCVHNTFPCNGKECNCGTCPIPCFPDFWNACGSYKCGCSTCYDTCSSNTCSLL